MARKVVTEIQCSRCGAYHYEKSNTLEGKPEQPAATAAMNGKTIFSFDDLCVRCTSVLETVLTKIKKPLEKKSPVRKPKDDAAAPPAPPPPPAGGPVPPRAPRG